LLEANVLLFLLHSYECGKVGVLHIDILRFHVTTFLSETHVIFVVVKYSEPSEILT
jgi:hypothetical protein